MPSTFDKLNLKNQSQILVVNAPQSFEPELAALKGVTIARDVDKTNEITFSLSFVTRKKDIDSLAKIIAKRATGDAVIWFAYPKGASKRYTCEFNRDTGWDALGAAGYEPVRMVAIDEDWSAVRFRRAEFIKTMTRDAKYAMSAKGKEKAGKSKR
jgi:hypothetical protein